MQATVSAATMWLTTFVVIMQMGVSVTIMQMVFSAAHYAHDCFYSNYAGKSFFYSYVGDNYDASKNFCYGLRQFSFKMMEGYKVSCVNILTFH